VCLRVNIFNTRRIQPQYKAIKYFEAEAEKVLFPHRFPDLKVRQENAWRREKREQQTVYHAPAASGRILFLFQFSSVLLHPTSASASDCRYLFVFPAVVRGMLKGRRYIEFYIEYIIVIDFSVRLYDLFLKQSNCLKVQFKIMLKSFFSIFKLHL